MSLFYDFSSIFGHCFMSGITLSIKIHLKSNTWFISRNNRIKRGCIYYNFTTSILGSIHFIDDNLYKIGSMDIRVAF